MSTVWVALSAAAFALTIFPIHIRNYVYLNTGQQFAGVNVGVYGLDIYRINTVKGKPRHMQVNGTDKTLSPSIIKKNFYRIFDKICLYKVIQLTDYGLLKEDNAYVALLHSGLTTAIYKFIQMNGNYCKLRNYTIFNQEHRDIRYFGKIVTILNLFVVTKIIFILITEKINEN